MTDQQEKKRRRIAGAVSLGTHLLLLLLFIFLLAWKEPYPPVPEYGIELNFGLEQTGGGNVQPQSEPTQLEAVEESPDESEEASEQPEDTEPAEQREASEAVPTDESTEETVEKPVETQDIESPDVQPEEAVETPVEPSEDSEKRVVKEVEEVVESPDKTTETPRSEAQKEGTVNKPESSQGDQIETVGDAGDPEGKLDARALYGKPGGGDGAMLDLAGWMWDFIPRPNDRSNEDGKIVFEVVVDDQGYLVSVRTIEKTVSPSVEKIYREEVEKLTFTTTSENTRPAPRSTGRITFLLRSK